MKIRPIFPSVLWGYATTLLATFAQIYAQNNAYIREKNREKMPCLTQAGAGGGRVMLGMSKDSGTGSFLIPALSSEVLSVEDSVAGK
jgi:hypothetical protein